MILIISIISALFVWFYIGPNELMPDQILFISATGLIMLSLFIYTVMSERKKGTIIFESTSYIRLFFIILIQWVINQIYPYEPEFLPVFMFIAFLILPGMGLICAFEFISYDVLLFCITTQPDSYVLVYLLCEVSMGVLFSALMLENYREGERELRTSILLGITTCFNMLFYFYNANHFVSKENLIISVMFGIGFLMFGLFIYPLFIQFFKREKNALFRAILSNSAMFRQEIKNFSESEYAHALRVSELSASAAGAISCDTRLARAGGLYYRLGKIYDKDNSRAIKIMEDNCFPREVIDIVYEYNGIMRRPTTRESAIIHMVDNVITRIELMNDGSMKSSWNQDMVIYQILNELSQKGIYDNSGLSMNQYLKVRDFLVNTDLTS